MTRQNDPLVPLRATYASHGVRSLAVLPLTIADNAVGAIALYASESEFFHPEELKLLVELADDVAFAIGHIQQQERLEYLAYFDDLTELANRAQFLEQAAQAHRCSRHRPEPAGPAADRPREVPRRQRQPGSCRR